MGLSHLKAQTEHSHETGRSSKKYNLLVQEKHTQ